MTIKELNGLDEAEFVKAIGPVFENSPWIAKETWPRRPFLTRDRLLYELSNTILKRGRNTEIELIKAHPDLAGRLAERGELTGESTREQAEAGLSNADKEVKTAIQDRNKRYRKKIRIPLCDLCTAQ